ncbi:MAG TPA: aldo/keto reductase [Terriglobales bacterium]|nr:aldo/keto reductase [Terriglobales bacterium]
MKNFRSWNRRDVLTKPLTWLAASRLLGGCDFLFGQTTSAAGESAAPIIYRTLGKTGLRLPVISMGVMNASIPGVVRRAYEVGMRHFDTAAMYQQGRNEEMVGKVIKELGVRDKVIISTKAFIPPPMRRTRFSGDQLRKIFEGSLVRLQMDHVDILYYHSVDSADEAGLEGPLSALTALKKEGKTRFIGISTHSSEAILNEAAKLGVYDVALVVINYTMASDKGFHDAIDRAAKKGIGLVAMKTQAGGTARPDPKLPKNLPPHSQTALLKWVLQNEAFATAIPGFTTFEQLEQNFTVARNLAYTEPERQFLGDPKLAAKAEFCAQCGKCRADCPLHAEIPALMRSHMYAVQYSNYDLARDTLAGIAAGKGLDACASCTSCQATCRGNVNIARKISDLKQYVA